MEKKAIRTVSVMIFAMAFSKILGLFRDILMAYYYGDTMDGAAFITASKIPSTSFDLILGAAIAGVFIPIYNSMHKSSEKDKGNPDEFANVFISTILLVTGILSFAGIVFSKQVVLFITPGYDEATIAIASDLLKILFPMIIFTGSANILFGILQSKDEFLIPALVSSVSNIGVILYFVFLNKYFGIYGLSVAYLASWAIQLLTLIYPLYKKKYRYKFVLNFRNPELIRAIKTTIPILTGTWLVPIGILAGQRYASMSIESHTAVTAFNYSTQLFLIITGILAYGVCNYIFPKLARLASDKGSGEHSPEFADTVKTGLSALIFIMLPVSCLVYILKDEAIAVILMHGQFQEDVARMTAEMLSVFAPAMIMFAVIEFLNRVYYANNMPKIPMFASLGGIAVNIALCEFFTSDLLNMPPVFIAVANLCCQFSTVLVLAGMLPKTIKGVITKQFAVNIVKIIASAAISFIAARIMYGVLNNNAFTSGILRNIVTAVLVGVFGVVVYIVSGIILKTSEVGVFIKNIKIKRKAN